LLYINDSCSRDLGGAAVQFGPGAKVAGVKLASDFSAIQLSRLPINSTAEIVQSLLATFGLTVPLEAIRTKNVDSVATVADIKVEDPIFAEDATRVIEDQLRKEEKTKLKVCSKAVSNEYGSSANRLQISSVSCTWYKASCIAWLHYRHWDRAQKAEKFLNSGGKVLGRKLECKVQGDAPEGWHDPNRIYSVRIGNLNVRTTADDLRGRLRGRCEPSDVVFGRTSYTVSDNQAGDIIKALLTQIGSLEIWETNSTVSATRMKGMAKFQSAEDARKAVKDLSGTKIPQLGNSKLFVNPLISVKFTILTDMYQIIQAEIDTLGSHIWEVGKVHIKDYKPTEPGQKLIAVRIYGEDAKSVAKAKSALEKILAGSVVIDNNTALWNDFFAMPKGLIYLKELFRKHNTFIYRDIRKSRLTLYGSIERQGKTRKALIQKVIELSQQTHMIILTPDMLGRALQGGLRQIAATLGKHVASLDVKRKPNTITIRGSARDFGTAQLLLSQAGPSDLKMTDSDSIGSATECAVCWTDAEDAFRTRCGHFYCRDCFGSQCTSDGDGDLPISCLGDSGKCAQIFSLDELKDGLTDGQFENLLEASFATYIRTNPAAFQYCSTPDCPQVYRSSTDGKVHNCQSCLTPICTTCHVVSHDGLNCADYKDLASESTRAFEQWKEKNDVKTCPKCKTAIEKSYGCNHMECINCHVHFCWFCMEVYDTGAAVYGHMTARHGSFV